MAFLLDRINRMRSAKVEPTPYEVVYAENKLRLRYYQPDADSWQGMPVALTYAPINTPTILDIDHDRSVVGQFIDCGFDVHLIDWGEPSALEVYLSLYEYVGRYLDNCIDVVRGCDASEGLCKNQ